MHDRFDWFFSENMIKFPELLSLDPADQAALDADLIQYQKEKDDRKFEINEKLLYDDLSDKATQYFAQFTEMASSSRDAPMFSTKSILNKLNFENSTQLVMPQTIKESPDE